jgi:membrane protease YdiL (CAAX protease family)
MSTTPLTRDRGDQETTSGVRLSVAVVAWIAASAAVGFATYAIGKSVAPEWASDPHNLAVVITAEVYALLVTSLLLVVGGGGRTRTALALKPVGGRDVLLGLAVLGGVYAVSALGYAAVHTVASPEPSAMNVILGIGSDAGRLADAGFWTVLLIITRILVLVPLGEEILFRGALYGWLRRRLSARWTIVITAALFAAIHQFLVILPIAFLFGTAMGWVRKRTGSVIPAIIAHSLNGLLLILLSYLASGWTAPLPF